MPVTPEVAGYVRNGCPGTNRSRHSRRTTRRTLRRGERRVKSGVPGPLGAWPRGRDDAYVRPVLVGRLTTAARSRTQVDGRRLGGRSRFSSQEGRPVGSGGPDQEKRREMARVFSGVKPTGHLTLGNYLGATRQWAAVDRHRGEELFCVVDPQALTVSTIRRGCGG